MKQGNQIRCILQAGEEVGSRYGGDRALLQERNSPNA